jgi:endonuclease YncB( thermonuclease family)
VTKPPLGITARAHVVRVIDGDTLELMLTIPMVVRLLDCWAPESRTLDLAEKKLGLAAKQHLSELTLDGLGTVHIPTGTAHSVQDVMTLGRVLGRVWMDGQTSDLSTLQVINGFAATHKTSKLGS